LKKNSKTPEKRALAAAPTPADRRKVIRKPYLSPLGLDVQTLEQSFKLLQPNLNEVVKSFYTHLFRRYPNIQPLFARLSKEEQEEKLLTAFNVVMNNLRKPDVLVNTLWALGKRHKIYGAMPEHYAAVVSTMLDILNEYIGDVWTPKVQEAWGSVLETIAATMLKAYGTTEGAATKTSRSAVREGDNTKPRIMGDLSVQDVLEHAPFNILIADVKLHIEFVNQKAAESLRNIEAEITGVLPDFKVSEILGTSVYRYYKDPNVIDNVFGGLNQGDVRNGEITPGRFVFEYEIRGLFDAQCNLKGYIVYWRDVSGNLNYGQDA